jgi:hypothetical protein
VQEVDLCSARSFRQRTRRQVFQQESPAVDLELGQRGARAVLERTPPQRLCAEQLEQLGIRGLVDRPVPSGRKGPDLSKQAREHSARVQMILGDRARGSGMACVVEAQRLNCGERPVGVLEREQACAGREPLAEPGVLRDHRPSRREVCRAPVAEPAAARDDVALLGDPELGLRAADEGGVVGGRARYLPRIEEFPAVLTQGGEIGLVRMDVEGEREALVRPAG